MITIKSNQRVAIIGKTRSGKSVLMKSKIVQYKRVIIFDPKFELADVAKMRVDGVVVHSLAKVKENTRTDWLGHKKKNFFIVYQPASISKESFNELCKIVYYEANLVFVNDELLQLAEGACTDYHERIIRMGAARGIGLWTLVQRPKRFNQYVLSENEHFFIFKLQLEDDRKRMGGIIGQEHAEKLNSLEKYHYMYYSEETAQATICAPVPQIG